MKNDNNNYPNKYTQTYIIQQKRYEKKKEENNANSSVLTSIQSQTESDEWIYKKRRINLTMGESGTCERYIQNSTTQWLSLLRGVESADTMHTINVLKMQKMKFIHSIRTLSLSPFLSLS